MALSRVVSELFNVEKCRDLEIAGSEQGRSQPRRSEGAPASGRWARGWVRTNVSPSGAGVRGS